MMRYPAVLAQGKTPQDDSYGWLGDIVMAIMEALGPIGVGIAVLVENI